MPSFDVVSEVDEHELTNAVDQANKEISNRFDFKGSDAKIDLAEESMTLTADSDFQIKQMQPIVLQKLTKRGIDISCIEQGTIETSGQKARQVMSIKKGIDKTAASSIVKAIKGSKMKVQAAIQGEQVRVTGKKRDDLQQAIAMLKAEEFNLPLQYINFRD